MINKIIIIEDNYWTECICGHYLGESHNNSDNSCEAWINDSVGHCPCDRFREEY